MIFLDDKSMGEELSYKIHSYQITIAWGIKEGCCHVYFKPSFMLIKHQITEDEERFSQNGTK